MINKALRKVMFYRSVTGKHSREEKTDVLTLCQTAVHANCNCVIMMYSKWMCERRRHTVCTYVPQRRPQSISVICVCADTLPPEDIRGLPGADTCVLVLCPALSFSFVSSSHTLTLGQQRKSDDPTHHAAPFLISPFCISSKSNLP